ncbi:MAG: cytochrome c3 family protein [Anaerolineales bacterium]|jgi:hypothetical protein
MHKKLLFVLLLGLMLLLAACNGGTEEAGESPTPEASQDTGVEVPFLADWQGSGHADTEAEAFNHWNEDDPAVVEADCARCHSTPGYMDFLGADGTEAGVVDTAPEVGTTVECVACHNEVTLSMTSVVMPSGLELTGLGDESRCIQCHQGSESGLSVDAAIEELGLGDDDVSADLGFINIHYFAAAASKFGMFAHGGYQYEGQSYDATFAHVEEFDTCIECHNSHTLEVQVEACAECHTGVGSVEDLVNIRMPGSSMDYDGDGDIEEGIAFEIAGLQEKLYAAIQAYASETAGTAIAYSPDAYPYFFVDTNGDGEAGEDEANFGNRYASWTPRLLRAAYNYQMSIKDPGAYAHGGKYIIELLYDSIMDLNTVLSSPIDMAGTHRIDAGHFAGSQEAFRHWDEDGEVEYDCARCHSASGLPEFIANEGNVVAQPLSNGLQCTTCHESLTDFTLYLVEEVEFPSGATGSFEDPTANLCMLCHQGRESGSSIQSQIDRAGVGDNEVSESLRFSNPHYFAAGATLFGSDAAGMYEYEGQDYAGRNMHVEAYATCIDCHNAHALEVKYEECAVCHAMVTDEAALHDIRFATNEGIDFDGDGDAEEGIAGEIETMAEAVYAAMQDLGPIGYDGHSYPYWFTDTNGDGELSADEAVFANAYAAWTPRLLRAAYNYQWVQKDPGAFAHNGTYVLQVLYDTLSDLGANVSGMTRP